jgi:hypothetical protein
LAGLLGRLLRLLLPWFLARLLTLLAWRVVLTALLRLAFIFLIHNFSRKEMLKYHLNAHHLNNDRTWR